NRRDLYRSVRILSGKPAASGLQVPGPGRPKRGFAWVVALVAVIMVTAGSIGFASADDHGSGSAGITKNGGGGRGGASAASVIEDSDDPSVRDSGAGTVEHEQGGSSDLDGVSDSADRQRRQRGGA
ncbi:MAG: hypothetical protein MUQ27_07435, partial [Acidimicrobiia bacterium]|nr:hypothetical protein [Acidimicrobiia bacterium]